VTVWVGGWLRKWGCTPRGRYLPSAPCTFKIMHRRHSLL